MTPLFRFFVGGMFLAEFAILFQFDSFSCIFLIFVGPVVAILAFLAGQGNFDAHGDHSLKKQNPSSRGKLVAATGFEPVTLRV